jgi:hypothetical protein
MPASPILLTKIHAVRTELLAAEKAHPGSRNLKLLHARLTEALRQAHAEGLVEQNDVQTLGGGTDKSV